MAVLPRRLTKSVLDALACSPGEPFSLFWDPDLVGFGVRVSASGTKSFVVKRRNIRAVIDRADVISVDEARQRAIEVLASIGRGGNPIRERRERAASERASRMKDLTVLQVWEEYKKAKKQLRPKTLDEYEYALRTYASAWLNRPMRSITRSFVSDEHTRIREHVASNASSRLATGNSTANGVMRVLRALWNFAVDQEVIPDLGRNPVQSLSRNKAWYAEAPREAFIPESHLPAFYAGIHGYRSSQLSDAWAYRDLARLLLFTGLRVGEAKRLRWTNIDLDSMVIRLSASETKARRRLDLPMSDYVATLIIGRPRTSEWVFPGLVSHVTEPRPALRYAAREMAQRLGGREEDHYYSPHALRRTFVTVAESCDLSTYALKALVNHSFGSDITAQYIGRSDSRVRSAAQRVADRLTALCRPALAVVGSGSAA